MDAWLLELRTGQRVLDLCSATGSFSVDGLAATVVRLDGDHAVMRGLPRTTASVFPVCGDACGIPFSAASFDLVICNHGLEHVAEVEPMLQEIRRVLKPDGRLVISVPNGYGFCDGVYRFMFSGGGHVNRFRRRQAVATIENEAGVHLVQWHKLYSSFLYLRRLRDMLDGPSALPPRMRLMGRLRFLLPSLQKLLYRVTRWLDRVFQTDLAVYGWALYFDHSDAAPAEQPPYLNVCLNCGGGHPAWTLRRPSRSTWYCAACDTKNPFCAPFRGTL